MDWWQVSAICGSIFLSALWLVLVVLDTVRHHAYHWGNLIVSELERVTSAIENQQERDDDLPV